MLVWGSVSHSSWGEGFVNGWVRCWGSVIEGSGSFEFEVYYPRSPGTHIVGSWVIDSICLYRDPRTGTQYIGKASSVKKALDFGAVGGSTRVPGI